MWETVYNILGALFLVLAILAPGIVPTAINATFGSGRRSPVFNNIFILFGFATLSYGILAVIYHYAEIEFPLPILGTDFQVPVSETECTVQIPSGESKPDGTYSDFNFVTSLDDIAWATMISLGILYVWMISYRRRLLERGLKAIAATNHFGEKDSWTNTHSRPDVKGKFAVVRDLTHNMIYTGWILEFSEHDTIRELFMSKVEAHTFDHNLVSVSQTAYVGLPKDSVLINFYSTERRIQSAVRSIVRELLLICFWGTKRRIIVILRIGTMTTHALGIYGPDNKLASVSIPREDDPKSKDSKK